MDYDILKSVSQGSDGAQDAENSRIAAIADELSVDAANYMKRNMEMASHM